MFRTVIGALALSLSLTAAAQDKTLKFLLAYPPGASSDLLTRLLADKMRPAIGMNTIVENRAGAAGIVCTEAAKNSPGDGSTILLTPLAPMVALPHSHGEAIRYDPFKDFAPVAHVCDFQLAMVVNAELPAKNVAEFIALVKKDPRLGDYSLAGAGSLPHYLGVMFGRATGTEMTHIPYKGTAPALQALVAGDVKSGMFVRRRRAGDGALGQGAPARPCSAWDSGPARKAPGDTRGRCRWSFPRKRPSSFSRASTVRPALFSSAWGEWGNSKRRTFWPPCRGIS